MCPPGQYSTTGSSPGCVECAKGTYQPQPGQTSCIQCPGGNTTDHTGAISKDSCKSEYYFNIEIVDFTFFSV